MSILIKGMEMPKDGAYNIVHIHSDGHVSMPFWGKGMQIVQGIKAVPVPEHGRLIDAEEIAEHKYTTIPPYRKQYADGKPKSEEEVLAFKFGWNDALETVIRYAPTIIPADKEGEG